MYMCIYIYILFVYMSEPEKIRWRQLTSSFYIIEPYDEVRNSAREHTTPLQEQNVTSISAVQMVSLRSLHF